MKMTRAFSLTAKNGQVRYSTGPVVPFPMKLTSLRLVVNGDTSREPRHMQVTHNDVIILSGSGLPGETMTFDAPVKLPAGKQIFKVVAGPFEDGAVIEGQVEITLAVF